MIKLMNIPEDLYLYVSVKELQITYLQKNIKFILHFINKFQNIKKLIFINNEYFPYPINDVFSFELPKSIQKFRYFQTRLSLNVLKFMKNMQNLKVLELCFLKIENSDIKIIENYCNNLEIILIKTNYNTN